MASFNKVILAGNLTRDPELRYTPKGTAIAKLSLAVNRRWTGEDGQSREEVTYVDIDAFGKQAEVISKYFRKGSRIYIEGKLRTEKWEKDGQKRQKIIVEVAAFEFIDRKDDHSAKSSAPAPQAAAKPARQAPDTSDDVPF